MQLKPATYKALTNPLHLLATGFGSGLAPRAPGTAGSVMAVLLWLPMQALPVFWDLCHKLLVMASDLKIHTCMSTDERIVNPPNISEERKHFLQAIHIKQINQSFQLTKIERKM